MDKVCTHSKNADLYLEECEEVIEGESEDTKNKRLNELKEKIKIEEDEYKHIIHIINIKLVNIDNSFNRHNVCSHKKCLRRNDGTVTMTCKYKFPHEICDKSKIKLKYYDD